MLDVALGVLIAVGIMILAILIAAAIGHVLILKAMGWEPLGALREWKRERRR